MKTPDRCRSGTPPSAENGLRGLYFGVWCYRRPTIGASPATFHTVSEGEFCEVRVDGVLGSPHSPGGEPGPYAPREDRRASLSDRRHLWRLHRRVCARQGVRTGRRRHNRSFGGCTAPRDAVTLGATTPVGKGGELDEGYRPGRLRPTRSPGTPRDRHPRDRRR